MCTRFIVVGKREYGSNINRKHILDRPQTAKSICAAREPALAGIKIASSVITTTLLLCRAASGLLCFGWCSHLPILAAGQSALCQTHIREDGRNSTMTTSAISNIGAACLSMLPGHLRHPKPSIRTKSPPHSRKRRLQLMFDSPPRPRPGQRVEFGRSFRSTLRRSQCEAKQSDTRPRRGHPSRRTVMMMISQRTPPLR